MAPHPQAKPADSALLWKQTLADPAVQTLVDLGLREDLGGDGSLEGDLTSQAIFADTPQQRGCARLVSRSATVICGVPLALAVLQRLDPQAQLRQAEAEGTFVAPGHLLATFEARTVALLAAERLQLNFMMRLCGIAQAARAAVQAVRSAQATKSGQALAAVLDTRKTLPGFRRLDKLAVRLGGACNHRMGLYDAVLIKDNHVAAAGGVGAALSKVRRYLQRTGQQAVPIEVEVDSLAQLREALAHAPNTILLDNFDAEQLHEAVQLVQTLCTAAAQAPPSLEISGGVTLGRLGALAACGVERLSMGALTHTVAPPDLSLEFL
jgi:nicotinate-nucleotide pyrophosphorylase (carboxylating)